MTQQYYEKVLAQDPKAQDYYRNFEAPGVENCSGGDGFYPIDIFEQLQIWVEKGKAPKKTGRSDGDEKKGRSKHEAALPLPAGCAVCQRRSERGWQFQMCEWVWQEQG